jgi:hypothetical protein
VRHFRFYILGYNGLVPHFENPMRIIMLSRTTNGYIARVEGICFEFESHDNIKTLFRDLQYLILYYLELTDNKIGFKYFF